MDVSRSQMTNPSQLEELASLEAIYDGSDEVVIKRMSAHAEIHDVDSDPDLEVLISEAANKGGCLILRLWLPMDYLLECEFDPIAPRFELESSFFSLGQLSSFCGELDRLFIEQPHHPILFSWIEWLRTEAPDMIEEAQSTDGRALKLWVAEPADKNIEFKEPEVQTCSNCLLIMSCQTLQSCQHAFCSTCLAASIQVESANSSPHCCPLPSCRAPLSKEDVVCGERPPEAWMRIAQQINGTAFQDAIVFCPRCEDRGMDIPVLMGQGRSTEDLLKSKMGQGRSYGNIASLSCKCFSCAQRFCGICRSLCHPGSACFDDRARIVRLAKRRPPLASELQDMAVQIAHEIKKDEADKAKDFGDALGGQSFDSIQSLFLSWHEASILEAVAEVFGSDARLYEAPVSETVKQRFMAAYAQYPEYELRPAFHGSNVQNYPSIFENGLLIPGDGNSVRMAHGAAHGRGVYTANLNAAWLSRGFCSDPVMLVCGVLQTSVVRHVFDAMVVGDSSHVVPLLVCEASSSCHENQLPLPPPVLVKPKQVNPVLQKGNVTIAATTSPDKKSKTTKFKAKLAKLSKRH